MNTMEVSIKLYHDDRGNVTGYEIGFPIGSTPDAICSTSLDERQSPIVKSGGTIAERLVGAINTEFGLPPIPGMPR